MQRACKMLAGLSAGLFLFQLLPCGDAFAEELYGQDSAYDMAGMYVLNGSYLSYGFTEDDTAVIIHCDSDMKGAVEIPEAIDEKPVTRIAEGAFYEAKGVTAVTLPNTVRILESGAFYGCTALETIEFPASLTTIGEQAFYGDTALTLQELNFPDTLTSIGAQAFCMLPNLKKVTIPAELTSLGEYVFDSCGALECITVAPENPTYCDVDGILYDKSMETLLRYPPQKQQTQFTLPDKTKSVAGWAFIGAEHLEALDCNQAEKLGEEAFFGCNALKTVAFQNTLTEIETYCFCNCDHLRELTIPDSVQKIGSYALGFRVTEDGKGIEKAKGFHLNVTEGSAAQQYAVENGISQTDSRLLILILCGIGLILILGIFVGILISRRRNCAQIALGEHRGERISTKKKKQEDKP